MRLIIASLLVAAFSPAAMAGPKKKSPKPSPQPLARVRAQSVDEKSDGWVFDRRIPSKGPIRKSEVQRLLKKMNHPDAQ